MTWRHLISYPAIALLTICWVCATIVISIIGIPSLALSLLTDKAGCGECLLLLVDEFYQDVVWILRNWASGRNF